MLISKADVDLKTNKDGYTSLLHGLYKLDFKITKKNIYRRFVLASIRGHDKIVRLLIKSNANVNLKKKDNFTALHSGWYIFNFKLKS